MRIDRLSITNFCCFEQREFEFHPEFNLIVGVNGSGKTALFNALSISLSTWLLGISPNKNFRVIDTGEPRLATLRYGDKAKFDGAQRHDGRVRRKGIDGITRFAEQYPVSISTVGEVMGHSFTWARSKYTEDGGETFSESEDLRRHATTFRNVVQMRGLVTLPIISCYGAMRIGREIGQLKEQSHISGPEDLISKSQITRLEGYRDSISQYISIRDLIVWFARQAWMKFENGEETQSLRIVREALLGCIEGASDLFFDPQIGELMVFIEPNGSQPFVNLGDFQKNYYPSSRPNENVPLG